MGITFFFTVDELGVDQMGIDQLGVDHFNNLSLIISILLRECIKSKRYEVIVTHPRFNHYDINF